VPKGADAPDLGLRIIDFKTFLFVSKNSHFTSEDSAFSEKSGKTRKASRKPLVLAQFYYPPGRMGTWITLIGDGWIFLVSHSKTFVGGAGTLDELFEAIVLIQTRKITRASRS
jgi:hypothetical protein